MPDGFFYSHLATDPYFNMAFDEWLLSQAMAAPATVYVRLYSWQVGTITIGYNQDECRALDLSRLGQTPLIRRVTGGRAVYHDTSELTYAIVVNPENLSSKRSGSPLSWTSRSVAEALKLFLQRLGVTADYVRSSSPQNSRRDFFHKAPCFASNARYELLSSGRKVVASAQKRTGHVLLQHGSIKLAGVAVHPALDGPHVDMTCDLQPAGRKELTEAAKACQAAMADHLGISLAPATLSALQAARLETLSCFVRNNALKKRQIIERMTYVDSL